MSDIRDSLLYKKRNGYDLISVEDRLAMEEYCRDYMEFLNVSRTEHEVVVNAIAEAEEHGFVRFVPGMELHPGDKVYYDNRGKALALAVIGEKSLAEGCVMAGAHADSPRLDFKQIPLFEDHDLAFFKTHYYGGIKKYQWTTVPLEIHGTVVLKNGESIDVVIGREKDEPKFVVTDLLIHLAQNQMQKTLADGVTAEQLAVLCGSVPYDDDGSARVKLAIMSLLNDMYGITEEDFLSAELCAVPAYEVSEVGLDRSLIGGYGQDDKVCGYAALKAILNVEHPERTSVCILSDKEETGSMSTTGMSSRAFDYFMEDLCDIQGVALRRCYEKSFCISTDVCNAFDPLYPEVSEKENSTKESSNAKINYGVGVCKFTGVRGKNSTSDATAATVAKLRGLMEEAGVVWQMAELGKVDQGGGGTIARFLAERSIDTIDVGVPLLSMHSPFEVVGKLDCFMNYKAILAAYQKA